MSLTDCLSADYTAAYFLTEDWGEAVTVQLSDGTVTASTTSIWGDVEYGETSQGYVADMVVVEVPGADLTVDPVREDTVTRTADATVWVIDRVSKEREQWRFEVMRNVRTHP